MNRDFYAKVAECESACDLDALLSGTEPPRPAQKLEVAQAIGKIAGHRYDPYPVLNFRWFEGGLDTGNQSDTDE